QRGARTEESAVEAPRIEARHEGRAQEGEADLPAVVVARQNEVDTPACSAGELVGAVAKQETEVGRGHRRRVEGRPPGIRGPADGQGKPPDIEQGPATLDIVETGPLEGPANLAGMMRPVVVAQDRERAESAP